MDLACEPEFAGLWSREPPAAVLALATSALLVLQQLPVQGPILQVTSGHCVLCTVPEGVFQISHEIMPFIHFISLVPTSYFLYLSLGQARRLMVWFIHCLA